MKIGVCIVFRGMDTVEAQIAAVREQGFRYCQLLAWNMSLFTDENADRLNELFARYGVEISTFWCGWQGPATWNFYEGQKHLGLVPPEYREMRVGNLCDGSDFARKLGVTDIATHMGFIPESPYDPEFIPLCDAIRRVALYFKANGQNLLFETGQETPATMLRTFEVVGTDNLYINLDTANLILYGKANPVDSLDTYGKYVRNIHAKDGFYPTNGRELGKETRLGDGKVDFRAFFRRLHELGYDSHVTIEREVSGDQQIRDILHAKNYLTEIIEEIYGAGTVE